MDIVRVEIVATVFRGFKGVKLITDYNSLP